MATDATAQVTAAQAALNGNVFVLTTETVVIDNNLVTTYLAKTGYKSSMLILFII